MSKRQSRWMAAAVIAVVFFPSTPALAEDTTARTGKAAQASAAPEAVVREFYRWYLQNLNKNKDPRAQKATLRRYVTERFLKEALAETDADPFISAQDFDPGWEKNIAVSRAAIGGQKATTDIRLTGKHWSQKLTIALIRHNGSWKIDRILKVAQILPKGGSR